MANAPRWTGITYDNGWSICAISKSVNTMTANGMKRRASARARTADGLNATTNVTR